MLTQLLQPLSQSSSSEKRLRVEAVDGQPPPKKSHFSKINYCEKLLPDEETDWRATVCGLVGVQPEDSNEDVSRGIKRLTELIEKHQLQKTLSTASSNSSELPQPPKPYYKILHQITCHRIHGKSTLDHEAPYAIEGGHLVGQNRVKDIEKYALMSEPGLSFIITKEYACCNGIQSTAGDVPSPVGETLYLYSKILCDALELAARSSENEIMYPEIGVKNSSKSPHIWVHRERSLLGSLIQSTGSPTEIHLENFLEYFDSYKATEFREVDRLLAGGRITSRYLQYIFVSNHKYQSNRQVMEELTL